MPAQSSFTGISTENRILVVRAFSVSDSANPAQNSVAMIFGSTDTADREGASKEERFGVMAEIHEQLNLFGVETVRSKARSAKDRRRIDAAHQLMTADGGAETIHYLHSGFCQAALPHTRPKDEMVPWVRRNGPFQLVVRPGILPLEDHVINVGVPYGTKARLILIYLQTEARRRQSPVVDLGPSMSAWLRRLGLNPNGGARGNYGPVREQAMRIARCEFTMRWSAAASNQAQIADQRVVDGLQLWRDAESETLGEWVRHVRLTQPFFEHLMAYAVPLDERAIAYLKGSSLALDAYVWLAHRLPELKGEMTIPWHVLADHFGSEADHRLIAFRLREVLRDVVAVYPEARIDVQPKGLVLRPSQPTMPATTTIPGARLMVVK
jgi:hypothetical protein